jgi:hypothetical protein
MKIRFEVDQAACLRKGIDCPNSIVSVQIEPAKLPQEQRDKIADRLIGIDVCSMIKLGGDKPFLHIDGTGEPIRIVANGPKYEDLWAAICEEEEELKKPSPRQTLAKRLAEVSAMHSPPL